MYFHRRRVVLMWFGACDSRRFRIMRFTFSGQLCGRSQRIQRLHAIQFAQVHFVVTVHWWVKLGEGGRERVALAMPQGFARDKSNHSGQSGSVSLAAICGGPDHLHMLIVWVALSHVGCPNWSNRPGHPSSTLQVPGPESGHVLWTLTWTFPP